MLTFKKHQCKALRCLKMILFSCLTIFFTACAQQPETQNVNIHTVPTGAKITLDDGRSATTPCTFVLPTNKSVFITIEHPGYLTYTSTLVPHVTRISNGWYYDLFYDFPNPYHVILTPSRS